MEKETIEHLIGEYGWMILGAFFFLLGKSTIESAIEGLKVMAGNDLNVDDTIILNGRPARITRISLWKTTVFVYDVGCQDNGKPYIKGGNKLSIQNTKLKDHMIEKPLPMLDLKKWDDCKENK
jgi:hypothetical protein